MTRTQERTRAPSGRARCGARRSRIARSWVARQGRAGHRVPPEQQLVDGVVPIVATAGPHALHWPMSESSQVRVVDVGQTPGERLDQAVHEPAPPSRVLLVERGDEGLVLDLWFQRSGAPERLRGTLSSCVTLTTSSLVANARRTRVSFYATSRSAWVSSRSTCIPTRRASSSSAGSRQHTAGRAGNVDRRTSTGDLSSDSRTTAGRRGTAASVWGANRLRSGSHEP